MNINFKEFLFDLSKLAKRILEASLFKSCNLRTVDENFNDIVCSFGDSIGNKKTHRDVNS